jgi:hypothetical protein
MPGTRCSASLVTLATIIVASLASAVIPASAAAADDACALLTKQDAAAAFGEDATQSGSSANLPMGPGMVAARCEYFGSGNTRSTDPDPLVSGCNSWYGPCARRKDMKARWPGIHPLVQQGSRRAAGHEGTTFFH